MAYKINVEKGTFTVDVVTKIEHTLSVVMYNEEGVEKDVNFKKVVTLGKGFPKWYDEEGNLMDDATAQTLELCYSNRSM